MYIVPLYLSRTNLLIGWALLAALLLWIFASRPWRDIPEGPLLNVLPAFAVGLLLVWRLKAGLHAGLEIHLLGLTALTLMFGWRLATLGVFSVYLLLATSGKLPWAGLGWNTLLVGVLPILLAAYIHRFVYHKLPHNFFIFVFVSSFLNGAAVMIFTMLTLSAFMFATGSQPTELIQHEFMILIPLLMFPEAFLNGSLMAILVIYRPQWVLGFNEMKYMRD